MISLASKRLFWEWHVQNSLSQPLWIRHVVNPVNNVHDRGFPKVRLRDRRKLRYKLIPIERLRPRIAVIGAPLVYGQPFSGANAAPDLLRATHLIDTLRKKGAKVKDAGNLHFEIVPNDTALVEDCKYAKTVGLANQQIVKKVSKEVRDGRKCLVLGGDHSVTMGSISGHVKIREDAIVIWVDAHTDIHTHLTSTSGNLHGMPLGFLLKELASTHPPVPGLEWLEPCITADQLAFIGIRSVDEDERKFLRDLNILHFSTEDVNKHGVDYVMRSILEKLDPRSKRPIHFSFDVDALDPHLLPATGTPVPDGLSLRHALRISRIIHSTGRLSVMDLVELNPMVTSKWLANWSAEISCEIILGAMSGKKRSLPWQDKWKHRGAHLKSLVVKKGNGNGRREARKNRRNNNNNSKAD